MKYVLAVTGGLIGTAPVWSPAAGLFLLTIGAAAAHATALVIGLALPACLLRLVVQAVGRRRR